MGLMFCSVIVKFRFSFSRMCLMAEVRNVFIIQLQIPEVMRVRQEPREQAQGGQRAATLVAPADARSIEPAERVFVVGGVRPDRSRYECRSRGDTVQFCSQNSGHRHCFAGVYYRLYNVYYSTHYSICSIISQPHAMLCTSFVHNTTRSSTSL